MGSEGWWGGAEVAVSCELCEFSFECHNSKGSKIFLPFPSGSAPLCSECRQLHFFTGTVLSLLWTVKTMVRGICLCLARIFDKQEVPYLNTKPPKHNRESEDASVVRQRHVEWWWVQDAVADPGGALDAGPLAPKICFLNHAVFRQVKEKTLFWANFGLRTHLGVKTPLAPLTKILDPCLVVFLAHAQMQDACQPEKTTTTRFQPQNCKIAFGQNHEENEKFKEQKTKISQRNPLFSSPSPQKSLTFFLLFSAWERPKKAPGNRIQVGPA